jgi:DHA1 family quinolone resistance protein-like MFS transporter
MFPSINKVIKILIFSDLIFLFGWGLITPILAIFIEKNIIGGDVKVAGIAIGIYWLAKSIIEIPIGRYLDRNHGEKDDFYFLVFGTTLASLTPLGFIFAKFPWQIYFLQLLHALGMAMAIPSWGGIFIRHIDKGKEAFSWSLESASLGIGTGVAGIIGGSFAKIFGFFPLFVMVSIFGTISSFLLFLIKKDLLPKERVYLLPKPH